MGPYGRPSSCESYASIDIRHWYREGRLKPGRTFAYHWEVGGKLAGGIRVRVLQDKVVLMYMAQSLPQERALRIEQPIPITWTDCYYGGQRPWFVCTAYSHDRYCQRRVAVLYGTGQTFACRACLGSTYQSQQETPHLRAIRKARKIRMSLGGGENVLEPFPPKPKHMHWRTYERLKASSRRRALDELLLRDRNFEGLDVVSLRCKSRMCGEQAGCTGNGNPCCSRFQKTTTIDVEGFKRISLDHGALITSRREQGRPSAAP
jgi:hypothetical protein